MYFVYCIHSKSRAYIGATVDAKKRLRQHNGELVGGALRTRGKGPWSFFCVIRGFRTWKEALQFEWAFKYYTRRCRGLSTRKIALEELMKRERWTSNSPLSSDVPLEVEYSPTQYGAPPENYEDTTMRPHDKPPRKKKVKKKFRERLHGVTY